MRKFAKQIGNVILCALAIYIGVFGLWLMMAIGCIQYEDQHQSPAGSYCGGDTFTQIIRTTHAPIIKLLW